MIICLVVRVACLVVRVASFDWIFFSTSFRVELVLLILLRLLVLRRYPQKLMVSTYTSRLHWKVKMLSSIYLLLDIWIDRLEFKARNQCGFAGYLKSWDSSIDLVNVLKHEIRDGQLSFRGKRVLEVIKFEKCLLLIIHALSSWFEIFLFSFYCLKQNLPQETLIVPFPESFGCDGFLSVFYYDDSPFHLK